MGADIVLIPSAVTQRTTNKSQVATAIATFPKHLVSRRALCPVPDIWALFLLLRAKNFVSGGEVTTMADPGLLRLAFFSRDDRSAVSIDGPYFRITGGVIWDRLEHGLIAHYVAGKWKHRTRLYTDLLFEGACQLMFGITRDLCALSGPLNRVSIEGPLLHADGTPFAQYHEENDMWAGLGHDSWWISLQIISVALIPAAMKERRLIVPSISRSIGPLPLPERARGSFE